MSANIQRSNPVFFTANDAIHPKHPSRATTTSSSFHLGTRHDKVADDRLFVTQ